METFFNWWIEDICRPMFMVTFVENPFWTMMVCAAIATVLMGLFYNPQKDSWGDYDPFERFGVPALVILFSGLFGPFGVPMILLILPVLLAGAVIIGSFFLLYTLIFQYRRRGVDD